jgi:hypothetical protein
MLERVMIGIALAIMFVVVAVSDSSGAGREPLVSDGGTARMVIRGCGSEDGCSIDYRFGDRWVIKQVIP